MRKNQTPILELCVQSDRLDRATAVRAGSEGEAAWFVHLKGREEREAFTIGLNI
jgi:hypothetical protein